MAIFTWSDGLTEFIYTYDESEVAIKDQLRGLVGDVDGVPVSYKSDLAIEALATKCNNDLNEAAAQYAESCASRVLQIRTEVQQGSSRHGLRLKNFDPDAAYKHFMELATMFRNKNRPAVSSAAAASGKMCPVSGPTYPWWLGRR
jgi:hypothetical protein